MTSSHGQKPNIRAEAVADITTLHNQRPDVRSEAIAGILNDNSYSPHVLNHAGHSLGLCLTRCVIHNRGQTPRHSSGDVRAGGYFNRVTSLGARQVFIANQGDRWRKLRNGFNRKGREAGQ